MKVNKVEERFGYLVGFFNRVNLLLRTAYWISHFSESCTLQLTAYSSLATIFRRFVFWKIFEVGIAATVSIGSIWSVYGRKWLTDDGFRAVNDGQWMTAGTVNERLVAVSFRKVYNSWWLAAVSLGGFNSFFGILIWGLWLLKVNVGILFAYVILQKFPVKIYILLFITTIIFLQFRIFKIKKEGVSFPKQKHRWH